ncbi:MAG: hypothetical protein QMC96_09025 [Methanomicrobiales archaeon]|nr:hypothetical protein [Methanomicrobiales archaeon]
MGLLKFFRVGKEAPDNLELLETMVRGSAFPKGTATDRSALAMSELLDPRSELQALAREGDPRASARFSDMADPAAVENLLKQLRRERG